MARITLNIEADSAGDMREQIAQLFAASFGAIPMQFNVTLPEVPHDSEDELNAEPDAGATQDADPGERQRRKRRTKAEMEAIRSAETAALANPTLDSATPASTDSAEATSGPQAQDELLSDGLDDDADAEGLAGISEAQDRLDREYAETMREAPPLQDGAAKPAASTQGGHSAQTATDASPEAQTASGASSANGEDEQSRAEQSPPTSSASQELAFDEPENEILAFIHNVPASPTWNDGKQALANLMKTEAWAKAQPHEQRGARLALWNIPARVRDKVDPGQDATAFMTWLEAAPEEDQVDGTLMVLERSDAWSRLTPGQHEKIRTTAAQAKRRIADRMAAE